MPDMTQDKRLDELITELEGTFYKVCDNGDGVMDISTMGDIANFIFAREKKMLSEIEKPLKENILKYPLNPKFPADRQNYPDAKLAVLEALATINKYKG